MLTQAAAYKRLNTQQPVFAVHINGERVGLHADYDRALDHANDLNLLGVSESEISRQTGVTRVTVRKALGK